MDKKICCFAGHSEINNKEELLPLIEEKAEELVVKSKSIYGEKITIYDLLCKIHMGRCKLD